MTLSYPPPYQDRLTLAQHLCICPETVDNWVVRKIIPPGTLRGGKLMWKWADVEKWMDNPPGDDKPGRVKDGVEREREADRGARH